MAIKKMFPKKFPEKVVQNILKKFRTTKNFSRRQNFSAQKNVEKILERSKKFLKKNER